jgi:hypothetical protein
MTSLVVSNCNVWSRSQAGATGHIPDISASVRLVIPPPSEGSSHRLKHPSLEKDQLLFTYAYGRQARRKPSWVLEIRLSLVRLRKFAFDCAKKRNPFLG